MAEANRLKTVMMGGTYGNYTKEHSEYEAVALDIAEVIDFLELPAGTKLFDCELVYDALGASSTLNLGWRYKDGSAGGSATALLAAASTASAGARQTELIAPIKLEKPVIIYSTVAGAAITGTVGLKAGYVHQGTQ